MPGGNQMRLRGSLRRKLPLLIIGLLTTIGAAFSWLAHREVQQALRLTAMERVRGAADQVSELLSQSVASRSADTRLLAADPEIARVLSSGVMPFEKDLPAALRAFVSRNPQATVWLHDTNGGLLGPVQRSARRSSDNPSILPEFSPTKTVSPLGSVDGRIWYRTTAAVRQDGGAGTPIGHLSIARSLASSPAAGLVERIIGDGAVIKLGNATGDLWTDLSSPVPPPPFSKPGTPVTYVREDGDVRVGTAIAVKGTPWLVWAELPEAAVLKPARVLLTRMLPIALLTTAFGAVAAYVVSARVTRPLEHVTDAAEALADGDYTRRVVVRRLDEIGRLGAAFNVMADRVAESQEALEARVRSRTQELEQAREELDQFFSLSLDLLCIAGIDGRFRRVNPAWERVLGWTAEDLTSAPYLDFVHPDDLASTSLEAARLSEGVATLSFENRYRCKDGSYRWLSWKAAPLPSRGLIYAAAHDITEQRRAAGILQQHASALENANRELEAFSYSVSHDLRAPLRSIDGFAQALVEDCWDNLDGAGRDFLSRIRAAAQRMGELIDDLLALSRVTRAELTSSDVDLSLLVQTIAARLQEQDAGRTVEWHVDPGVRTRGDAQLLKVALENLLANAWKFTVQRAVARIEFRAGTGVDGTPLYEVRDNGAGFDMEYAGKLFGAFQRLHSASEFPGTGVGLATVQRIVHRHGGRIWAKAAVDTGASFSFTLRGH